MSSATAASVSTAGAAASRCRSWRLHGRYLDVPVREGTLCILAVARLQELTGLIVMKRTRSSKGALTGQVVLAELAVIENRSFGGTTLRVDT